jgi:hypothetical protein
MARKKKNGTSGWSLDDLLKAVETTYLYEKDNYKRYHDMRSFIYFSTIDKAQENALRKLGKPPLSFNSLEAYVSKQKGEFAKHLPSIALSQPDLSYNIDDLKGLNPESLKKIADEKNKRIKQMEFAEGYIQNVVNEGDKNNFQNESYDRCLTGGFNVVKVYPDYENEVSFWQKLCVMNSFDPTLCGFDPKARDTHKGDGEYCFEIFPMELGSFKRKYPKVNVDNINFSKRSLGNFTWAFRNGKIDYILVCDMYIKKEYEIEVVQLPDGSAMDEEEYEETMKIWDKERPNIPRPEVADTRISTKTLIYKSRFIQTQMLEEEETDFKFLPLVYIDGNKVNIQNSNNYEVTEIRRPYFWQAISMQKLKDRAGQTWAHTLENLVAHKWIVSLESLPSEDPNLRKAYTNNQIPAVMLYHERMKSNEAIQLSPPQAVTQAPMPQEVMAAFSMADQAFQFILGSYDSSLGINDNQLSGTAIMEGATQSNAAAMPFLMSHLQGMVRIGEIILDLIPKYLTHGRPIEIMNKNNKKLSVNINDFGSNSISTDFDARKIKVDISADANFSIQKARALTQIQSLCQYIPALAGYFGSRFGMPVIIKNLEFNGADDVKNTIEPYFDDLQKQQAMQMQSQNQAMQNSPDMLKAKAAIAKVQGETANRQQENKLRAAEIAVQNQDVQNDRIRIMADSKATAVQQNLQLQHDQIEKENHAVDTMLETVDMNHRHNLENKKLASEHVNNVLDNMSKLNNTPKV